MGHYDDCYEQQDDARRKEKIIQAKKQLKLMEKLIHELHSTCGADGISRRHLEHLEDMINETILRTRSWR